VILAITTVVQKYLKCYIDVINNTKRKKTPNDRQQWRAPETQRTHLEKTMLLSFNCQEIFTTKPPSPVLSFSSTFPNLLSIKWLVLRLLQFTEKERVNGGRLLCVTLGDGPDLPFYLFDYKFREVRLICVWTPVRARIWEGWNLIHSGQIKEKLPSETVCLLICVATNKYQWIINWR